MKDVIYRLLTLPIRRYTEAPWSHSVARINHR